MNVSHSVGNNFQNFAQFDVFFLEVLFYLFLKVNKTQFAIGLRSNKMFLLSLEGIILVRFEFDMKSSKLHLYHQVQTKIITLLN